VKVTLTPKDRTPWRSIRFRFIEKGCEGRLSWKRLRAITFKTKPISAADYFSGNRTHHLSLSFNDTATPGCVPPRRTAWVKNPHFSVASAGRPAVQPYLRGVRCGGTSTPWRYFAIHSHRRDSWIVPEGRRRGQQKNVGFLPRVAAGRRSTRVAVSFKRE